MFKSQTSRVGRLPHLATAAALVFTIALGLMQPASYGDTSTSGSNALTNR